MFQNYKYSMLGIAMRNLNVVKILKLLLCFQEKQGLHEMVALVFHEHAQCVSHC